jgi:hypothetical protein
VGNGFIPRQVQRSGEITGGADYDGSVFIHEYSNIKEKLQVSIGIADFRIEYVDGELRIQL